MAKLPEELAKISRLSLIYLTILLAFLIPFGPDRNIDLQGLILIILGALAAVTLVLQPPKLVAKLGKLNCWLIGIFVAFCIISFMANPNSGYDFLGAPYIRLGSAGLIACILVGLVMQTIKPRNLMVGMYLALSLFSLSAIPYSLIVFHSLNRLGGLFSQADLLGVFIGCNIILGLELARRYKEYRTAIALFSLLLFAELVMTQTRTVIYLIIVLALVWYLSQTGLKIRKAELLYLVAAVLIFVGVHAVLPSQRLTNLNYAQESISYRLELQKDALKSSLKKPLFGYGAGNLADALKCSNLPQPALQKTCSQNFYFNSSHNIYIDRILGIGFIGGLSYILFVVINILRALKKNYKTNIYGYICLLIGLYYFTNVTNLELEMLFWISLIAMIMSIRPNNRSDVKD